VTPVVCKATVARKVLLCFTEQKTRALTKTFHDSGLVSVYLGTCCDVTTNGSTVSPQSHLHRTLVTSVACEELPGRRWDGEKRLG
jgi:hypothetical protein